MNAQAASGAAQLHTGLTQLNAGASSLSSGASALSAGASTLADGASQVSAGAGTVQDGTQTMKDTILNAEKEAAGEVAEEEAPQSNVVEAKLNEAISKDDYDLTFTECFWDETDEEGKWVYASGDSITRSMLLDPGTQVFVVRASITSKATSTIQPSLNYRGAATINGKYEYDVRATSTNGVFDIAPFETQEVLIYVEVPQAMKEQFEDIDIKWGFTVDDTYPQKLDDVYEVYDLYFK